MEEIEYIDINLHGTNINDNILDDKLSLFFQEIEIALTSAPNEIWGIKDSINLARYIFNKYVTITQIKNEITSYISKHCQHAVYFPYKISVELIKNNNHKDMVYIVMNVVALDINGKPQDYAQKFLIGK